MEAESGAGTAEAAQKLERQYNLRRLQEAAAAQERAAQEARLAKRQSFIDAQVSGAPLTLTHYNDCPNLALAV